MSNREESENEKMKKERGGIEVDRSWLKFLVPAVTQTLNLTSIRVLYSVRQQIVVVFEGFYRLKKQNSAWFRLPKQR